jgi:hypothetical protein
VKTAAADSKVDAMLPITALRRRTEIEAIGGCGGMDNETTQSAIP